MKGGISGVCLQHAHGVVHGPAEFGALELRDLAVHDFEVVLHLHSRALPHLRLDGIRVDARDAEAGQDVLHFHGDLVLSVFHGGMPRVLADVRRV